MFFQSHKIEDQLTLRCYALEAAGMVLPKQKSADKLIAEARKIEAYIQSDAIIRDYRAPIDESEQYMKLLDMFSHLNAAPRVSEPVEKTEVDEESPILPS